MEIMGLPEGCVNDFLLYQRGEEPWIGGYSVSSRPSLKHICANTTGKYSERGASQAMQHCVHRGCGEVHPMKVQSRV